eukprot:1683702-Rhodomonas_salina.1
MKEINRRQISKKKQHCNALQCQANQASRRNSWRTRENPAITALLYPDPGQNAVKRSFSALSKDSPRSPIREVTSYCLSVATKPEIEKSKHRLTNQIVALSESGPTCRGCRITGSLEP